MDCSLGRLSGWSTSFLMKESVVVSMAGLALVSRPADRSYVPRLEAIVAEVVTFDVLLPLGH